MGRLLVLALVAWLLYTIFRKRSVAAAGEQTAREEETFRDPVCGIYVSEQDAVIGKVREERIHFCSTACLEKYRKHLQNSETNEKGNGS